MPNITALPTLEGYGFNGNSPLWAVGGPSGQNLYARAWASDPGRGTIVYQFTLSALPAGSVITNCRIRFQTLNSTGTWDYRFQKIALVDNATAPTAITVNGTSPNRPMDHRDAARFIDPAVDVRFYADSAGVTENDPRGSGMLQSLDIYTTDIKEQLQYLVSSPYWNPATSVINVIWYGELNAAISGTSASQVRRNLSYIHVDYTAPPTPTGTMTAAAGASGLIVPAGQRYFAGDLLGAGYGNLYTIANDAPFDGLQNTGVTGGLGYDSGTMIYDDLSVNYDGEIPHATDTIFIVGVSRMGSRARLGGTINDFSIWPVGIQSTSTIPGINIPIPIDGIDSTSTIGTGIRIDRTFKPTGFVDPDTIGAVRVDNKFTVTGYSPDDDVLGTVRIDRTVRVTGIPSSNSFGAIRTDFSIGVYAIVENEDLIGQPIMGRADYINPTGIDEGLDTLGEITATYILNVAGILSSNTVGQVVVNRSGYVTGVTDDDTIPAVIIDIAVPVTGIPNTDTIGSVNASHVIYPAHVQDENIFGALTISKTNTINAAGIIGEYTNIVGNAQVDPTYGFVAVVFGDGDDDTIGTLKIDRTLPVTGYVDPDTISSPILQGYGYISVSGITSTSSIPDPVVQKINTRTVSGITSNSFVGLASVGPSNTISPTTVSEADVIGTVGVNRLISPDGIDPTNTIGTVTQVQSIYVAGVSEADVVGTVRFAGVYPVIGITDPDIIPPVVINGSRTVTGIQSTSTVGNTTVSAGFFVEIIPPDNTIGTIAVNRGIVVTGITEPDEFGLIYIPVLHGTEFFIFFHLGF